MDVLVRQRAGQMAPALPSLCVVRIEEGETSSAFLVKKICAQGDLTSQVIKQVAHVQWFVDAVVAAVVKLVGVQIPTLDEWLGQHQGRSREFSVRNWQAFTLYHRVISITRWSSAQQAKASLRAIVTPGRSGTNVKARPPTVSSGKANPQYNGPVWLHRNPETAAED